MNCFTPNPSEPLCNGTRSFVGVDGCKAGWFAAVLGADRSLRHLVAARIDEVVKVFPGALILVDVPIGLRDSGRDERLCDKAARQLLGKRGSSVFPAPTRVALDAPDYGTACDRNFAATCGARRLSKQSWANVPKIRQVDEYLRSHRDGGPGIREMHPEVCFWGLNAGRPPEHGKASHDGYAERIRLLARHVPDVANLVDQVMREHRRSIVARDDIVDAVVGAVTAFLARDRPRTLPARPEHDAFGLAMEMVYASVVEETAGGSPP